MNVIVPLIMLKNEDIHHITFQRCIDLLVKDEDIGSDTISKLCEKEIHEHKSSVCYYDIYIQFLHIKDDKNKKEKIANVMKRCIQNAQHGCIENVMLYSLERSLRIAAEHLTFEEYKEIVREAFRKFPLQKESSELGAEGWLATRRAALMAVYKYIQRDGISEAELTNMYKLALLPLDQVDYFKCNKTTEDMNPSEYGKKQIVKLVRCYAGLHLQKLDKPATNPVTLQIWNDHFGNANDTVYIRSYLEFIRAHGSTEETFVAYKNCIQRLSEINSDSKTSNIWSKDTQLLLIEELLEQYRIHEPSELHLDLSRQFTDKVTIFSFYNKEKLPDEYPRTMFLRYPPEPLTMAGPTPTVVTHMEIDTSTEGGSETHRIYACNLKFAATEDNVRQGFADNGVNVVSVRFMKTPCGMRNNGRAIVYLQSEDDVVKSLELREVEVLGRPTFIRPYYSLTDMMESNRSKTITIKNPDAGQLQAHIHNLPFSATEVTVMTTFRQNNIHLRAFKLMTNKKGHGVLHCKTAEDHQKVLQLGTIEVLGRVCYIQDYVDPRKTGAEAHKGPTVLHLREVPKEWQDVEKIEKALCIYGHIKSVTKEDQEGSLVFYVDFYMEEDAKNALERWRAGEVFKHLGIKIRLSFKKAKPGEKKQPDVEQKNSPEVNQTKLPELQSEPQIKKRRLPEVQSDTSSPSPKWTNTLVPTSLRRSMLVPSSVNRRTRIGVAVHGPTSEPSTSAASDILVCGPTSEPSTSAASVILVCGPITEPSATATSVTKPSTSSGAEDKIDS